MLIISKNLLWREINQQHTEQEGSLMKVVKYYDIFFKLRGKKSCFQTHNKIT